MIWLRCGSSTLDWPCMKNHEDQLQTIISVTVRRLLSNSTTHPSLERLKLRLCNCKNRRQLRRNGFAILRDNRTAADRIIRWPHSLQPACVQNDADWSYGAFSHEQAQMCKPVVLNLPFFGKRLAWICTEGMLLIIRSSTSRDWKNIICPIDILLDPHSGNCFWSVCTYM